jgi:hypothetical protein
MLHEFIFKFCANIQTQMLIIKKIILKYRSFVKKNQKSDIQWWYLYPMATCTCVLNLEYIVSNKLMISPRHLTWFLLKKISYLSLWNTSLFDSQLESVLWVLLFHPFYFNFSNLLFRDTHNRITTFLPMVSTIPLIKLVECFFTL